MNAMSYVCVIFDILRMHYCNTECHIKPKGSNSEQNILNDLVLIFVYFFSLSLFFFKDLQLQEMIFPGVALILTRNKNY